MFWNETDPAFVFGYVPKTCMAFMVPVKQKNDECNQQYVLHFSPSILVSDVYESMINECKHLGF